MKVKKTAETGSCWILPEIPKSSKQRAHDVRRQKHPHEVCDIYLKIFLVCRTFNEVIVPRIILHFCVVSLQIPLPLSALEIMAI
jgi:hypothetical protein